MDCQIEVNWEVKHHLNSALLTSALQLANQTNTANSGHIYIYIYIWYLSFVIAVIADVLASELLYL